MSDESPFASPESGRPLHPEEAALIRALAGGPAFSEGFEVGAPSFPGLEYGKGGVLRPRLRFCFLYLPPTFTFVRIIK
jgi:hypothetical protein